MPKVKLPKKILQIPNADKEFQEKWKVGDDQLDFPHSFRALLCSTPSCGKTTVIKNLILRQEPPFEEVIVIHCDPDYTQEYTDVTDTILDKIPSPSEWTGDCKTLVVLEDLEFKGMNKTQKYNLDRLYGFCSSHKNISVVCAVQDCFSVPPSIRRMSNVYIFWRTPDLDSLYMIARKSGIDSDTFKEIFRTLIKTKYDSLWIDNTDGTPYPLRLNGYYNIIES